MFFFKIIPFLIFAVKLNSQYREFIVVDSITQECIPFVNVYNKANNSLVKTDFDGKAKLKYHYIEDTILIKFLGYNDLKIQLKNIQEKIILTKKYKSLKEVVIKPISKKYLYDMIERARDNIFHLDHQLKSKCYFQLKSSIEKRPIELIEAYYNGATKGYQIQDLKLKAGRIALQKDSIYSRLFTSMDGTKPLIQIDWKKKHEKMPFFVLNLNKAKQKKHFYLEELERYTDENNDSIIKIAITPKDTTGDFFGGEIHLDWASNQIVKIVVAGNNLTKHPFESIKQSDKLENVYIQITSLFKKVNNKRTLEQIDFEVKSNYITKDSAKKHLNYPIYTQAILYFYDYHSLFNLPIYAIENLDDISDYTKILAYPYNEFFWNYNNEFSLEASKKANQLFFEKSTLNNQFQSQILNFNILKEKQFVKWSKNRIHFIEDIKERIIQTFYKQNTGVAAILIPKGDRRIFGAKIHEYDIIKQTYGNKEKPFHFDIQLFADYNKYSDTSNVLTATILNPYNSYYYLRVDNPIRVFMNLYFDIAEVERLNMIDELNNMSNLSYEDLLNIHDKYTIYKEEMWRKLSQETQNGVLKNRFIQWNQYIKNALDIDNFSFFIK